MPDEEADFAAPDVPAAAPPVTPPVQEPAPAQPAAVAPAQAAPPVSPHSRRMLNQALALGMTEQEIAECTAQDLRDEVHFRILTAQQQQQRQAPAPVVVPEPEEEINLGIDESQFAPELITAIKGLGKKQAVELKALKKQLADRELLDQARQEQQQLNETETFFSQYPAIYGAGAVSTLRAGCPEHLKRLAIFNTAKAIPGANWTAKLAMAHATINPQAAVKPAGYVAPNPTEPVTTVGERAIAAVADQNGTGRVTPEQWNAAGLVRPTDQAPTPQKKGVAKAKATFNKLMKDNGLNEEDLAGTPARDADDDGEF